LSKNSYQCEPIAIGVNTDAYQPLEKRLAITRQVLEVLVETNHPAYLITKSSLIERDIDLLTQLAERGLVSVCITITTLDRTLARKLEPRATTPSRRLQTLKTLSDAGIPTRVSVSPVIPALNEEEMNSIVEAAAKAGAQAAYAIVLRLPHELQQLFPEWLEEHYPLRAARVMKAIRSVRSDKLNNAEFGERMIGSGPRAEIIRQRFEFACRRAGIAVSRDFELDSTQFVAPATVGAGHSQLS
jgi:DNA repair photolyase